MNNLVRASIFCSFFLALTGQAPAPAAGDGTGFCVRLGRNMGLDESKLADGDAGWRANVLNVAQRFLIGGTATVSVDAEPVEPLTVEGYERAEGMCTADGKGAICRLVGPVNFKFGWKGTSTVTPVLPDEVAVVRVEGIRTTCQPGVADS